jgi:hypothetical protein
VLKGIGASCKRVVPREEVDERRVYESKMGLFEDSSEERRKNVDSSRRCALFKAAFTGEYQTSNKSGKYLWKYIRNTETRDLYTEVGRSKQLDTDESWYKYSLHTMDGRGRQVK